MIQNSLNIYSKQEVYRLVVNRVDNDGILSLLTFAVAEASIRRKEIVVVAENF